MPTATKRALVERFAALGFPRVEATSYSNPKVVPQFADASELLKSPGTTTRGFLQSHLRQREGGRARRSPTSTPGYGANEISLLVSATESHTQKNLNRTPRRAVAEHRRHGARRPRALPPGRHGLGRFRLPVRGQGRSGRALLADVETFAELGVKHVALGDTTGMATPRPGEGHVLRMK